MGCSSPSRIRGRLLENELEHLALASKPVDINEIVPSLGFVLKTRRLDDTKVFINICHHPNLCQLYTIPLIESKDKHGTSCLIYSCVLPTREYQKIEADSDARNKICIDAINYINTVYNETLGTGYTTPRIVRGYMGDSRPILSNIPLEYIIIKNSGSGANSRASSAPNSRAGSVANSRRESRSNSTAIESLSDSKTENILISNSTSSYTSTMDLKGQSSAISGKGSVTPSSTKSEQIEILSSSTAELSSPVISQQISHLKSPSIPNDSFKNSIQFAMATDEPKIFLASPKPCDPVTTSPGNRSTARSTDAPMVHIEQRRDIIMELEMEPTLLPDATATTLISTKFHSEFNSDTPASPVWSPENVSNSSPPKAPWTVPEFFRGWAKKRGHINVAFKKRYFTVDRGTISYFVNDIPNPPFGENLKGCFFVANCKIRLEFPSTTKQETILYLEPDDEYKRLAIDSRKLSRTESSKKRPDNDLALLFLDREEAKRWRDVFQSHIDWANNHSEYRNMSAAILEERRNKKWVPNLMSQMANKGIGFHFLNRNDGSINLGLRDSKRNTSVTV